jgi:hypothetical protein
MVVIGGISVSECSLVIAEISTLQMKKHAEKPPFSKTGNYCYKY